MASTSLRDNVATGYPDLTTANSPAAGLPTHASSVGTPGFSGDGRRFIWSYDGGTALAAGVLVQSPAQTTGWEGLALTTTSSGATSVTTGSTATITQSALQGGFMVVCKGTGKGETYAIADNTAATSAVFTVTLADPVRTALDTTSIADFYPSPYNGVIVNPTTATGAPVGATVTTTAGTQYLWVQTSGVIALQNDGASTINPGEDVAASVTTAGNVTAYISVGSTPAIVGIAVTTISGTNWGLVKLQLD